VNKTLGDTFLDPDLEYLLIAGLGVSLYILSAGLESKLKGSLHSSCLLETIIRRAIIEFYNLKMTSFVVFFQTSKRSFLFEAEVELNVRSALLSFLELPVDVGTQLVPFTEILFGRNIRVI